ncbi:type IV toxin-antitoxin system AbiEi family antitoxin domain-containing protein [Promicromonospora sukumoe]|uniref:type IV toxin-antitoxin system AbiEi family antitoxin domain-containing protein n=1 Tax=Promicromonospora sukumoe TaxID=88382 RepID=UPI00036EB21F|nr:type IV toxin-antitoxin system AbiEi family antitoxin domain-containing protein [Promicromonospora sukumoe]
MTAQDLLWQVALDQHGLITLSDARGLGISEDAVMMLAQRGKLERAATAVYRFPRFPAGPNEPYMLAVLWTGEPRACLSHDTALAAYDVSDINPGRVHLTVPRGRRIRRSGGDLYTVHHEDLADDETGWWDEIPTVTLPTAIRQCIDSGVPTYLIRQALERAPEAGRLAAADAEALTARLDRRA